MLGAVLAGGKSKRFQAKYSKVLANHNGKAIIRHVVEKMSPLVSEISIIVSNDQARNEQIREVLDGFRCNYYVQDKPEGTASALLACENMEEHEDVLMSYADKPLIRTDSFGELIDRHFRERAYLTLATAVMANPLSKGRVIRDEKSRIRAIVEHKNCDEEQRRITEVNTGIFICRTAGLRDLLKMIGPNPLTGEYYLTDLVQICYEKKLPIANLELDAYEAYDVNTIEQLEDARKIDRDRFMPDS